MAIDFRSDPIGRRIKGWVPRGEGKVKLVPGWEPRPEYGMGQDETQDDPPPDPTPAPYWQHTAYPPLPPTPPPDPGLRMHLGGSPPPAAPTPESVLPATSPQPVYTQPQTQPLSSAPSVIAGAPSLPSSAPKTPSAPSDALAHTPARRNTDQQQFLDTLMPTAKKVSAETGIPWQVLVAIPANETGWGQAVFHNNYFGVKDPKGQAARTWEVVNGQRQDITDTFATYDDAEGSMNGFASFLHNNPRYKDALDYINKNPSDWPQFVNMLQQQGYATDPNWATQVNSIGRGLESASTQPVQTLSPGTSNPNVSRGTGSLFDVAKSAVGTKYVWGGAGGRSNFDPNFVGSDCSGYVAWVYRNSLGIALPAQTQSIYASSKPIKPDDAVPGDLIMFNMNDPNPHVQHVAIYEGNGMMIHDSSVNPDGGVEETPIWSDGEFRRVQGVTPDDLSKPSAASQTRPGTPHAAARTTAPQPSFTDLTTQPVTDLTQATQDLTKPMGTGQEAAAEPTLSKRKAHYYGDAEDQHCHDCSMFKRGGACTLVKGSIDPFGTCDHYEARGSKKMGAGAEEGGTDTSTDPNADNTPWWEKAKQTVGDAASAVVQGAQQAVGGVVDDVSRAVTLPAAPPAAPEPVIEPSPLDDQPPPQARTAAEVASSGGGPATGVQPWGDPTTPLPAPAPAPQRQMVDPQPHTPGQPLLQTAPPPAQPAFVPGTRLPQLAANSPLTNPNEANPFARDSAFGDAAATTAVPDQIADKGVDTPLGKITVHDVAAQMLRPSALANTVTGGLEGTATSVGGAAVRALGGTNLPEQLAMKGAEVVVAKVGGTVAAAAAPIIAKAAVVAADTLGKPIVEHAVVPSLEQLAKNPFGKFFLEDAGATTLQAAAGIMAHTAKHGLLGGAAGAAVSVASDVTHSPQWTDPNWWGQVITDAEQNGKLGAELAVGGSVATSLIKNAPLAKWGWDHTVDPWVIARFRKNMEPMKDIPSPYAQAIYGERDSRIRRDSEVDSNLLQITGNLLFGKPGQGVNTSEAAAWVEEHQTLAGFRDPGTGATGTRAQIDWVAKRVAYENAANARMQAIGALSPTQDVRVGPGEAGPKTHMIHLYEKQVADEKRKSGVGWSDTVTHKRMEGNPATPGVPRTIRQAIDMFRADPVDNLEPLDDLVTRYSTSLRQTERVIANREAWLAVRNDPAVVHHAVPGGASVPDGWKEPQKGWGMGPGQEQYRVHPALATYLDNISGVSKSLRETVPGANLVYELNAPLKMQAFSGSPIHLFNVMWRAHSALAALAARDSPLGFLTAGMVGKSSVGEVVKNWILPTFRPNGKNLLFAANADKVRAAAGAHVTLTNFGDDAVKRGVPTFLGQMARMGVAGLSAGSWGWLDAKSRGASDGEAFDEAWKHTLIGIPMFMPGAGAAMRVFGKDVSRPAVWSMANLIHDAVFDQALPAAKVGMFDILTRGGADPNLAGELTNNTLGGVNMIMLGRAPAMQDIMRYGVAASDFEEGQVQSLINTFGPGTRGAFTRNTIAKGLAVGYAGFELMNLATSGHFSWDNEKTNQYDLEVTGALDHIADMTGDPKWRSVDLNGRPIRQYKELYPPLRWMLQTLGEGTRQAVDTFAQAEQGSINTPIGKIGGDPAMAAAGKRLQGQVEGDPGQGDLPPNVKAMLQQDVANRVGFVPNLVKGVGQAILGQPTDWTGKEYDPPGAEPQAPWSSAMNKAASILAPSAPSSLMSAAQKINVEHPSRGSWQDALQNGLGFTRTAAHTAVSEALNADEQMKLHLGFSPHDVQQKEIDRQNGLTQNDNNREGVFAKAPTSMSTHRDMDKILQKYSNERKVFSLRTEVGRDFANEHNVPDPDLRNRLIDFMTHVWDPKSMSSPEPADTNQSVDAKGLLDAWQHPQGIDPNDQQAMRHARSDVLKDLAGTTGEHPDALEDAFKWIQSNTDPNTGLVKPMPVLPGVTQDQLDAATTSFLDAGADPADKSKMLDDSAAVLDLRRAELDRQATALKVDPKVLLQRINLRLQGPDQPTGLEKSYNSAVQAYFDSRDPDKFPPGLNEDGTPMGAPEDWTKPKGYNDQIKAASARQKQYDPEIAPYVQAQKRAEDARKQFLLHNDNAKDYQRWFGLGANMTEAQYAKYSSGQLVGYKDLLKDPSAPKTETISRDKILQMYDASSPQERWTGPQVHVWANGEDHTVNLKTAYEYLHKPYVMLNTAGRTLEDTTASDDYGTSPTSDDASAQGVQ